MKRYTLDRSVFYIIKGDIPAFESEFVKISNAVIKVKKGYEWDGCTPSFKIGKYWFGTPEGKINPSTNKPITYYASLIHDVLYKYKSEVEISRKDVDGLFKQVLELSKFKKANLYYKAVRLLGGSMGKWKYSKFKNIKLIAMI